MVVRALEAAAILAEEGISVEVVDPRTLKPLDSPIVQSGGQDRARAHRPRGGAHRRLRRRTGAVIAESEGVRLPGSPIKRLAKCRHPRALQPGSGQQMVPQVDDIVSTARNMVQSGAHTTTKSGQDVRARSRRR
ncbi:MAG: transketolase C-terminal domain-containing protein [Caldilineaceae bacterium]